MKLGKEVGPTWPQYARWGPSCPKKGTQSTPNFRPMYCGQAAGWITMPLGTAVGLGPGHIVLDGDPAPKWAQPPIFGPFLLWPNGWRDEDAT